MQLGMQYTQVRNAVIYHKEHCKSKGAKAESGCWKVVVERYIRKGSLQNSNLANFRENLTVVLKRSMFGSRNLATASTGG